MKFETIKDNKKRIGVTIGIVGIILVIGVTAFTLTRASYKQTQSVPLIKGNISYNKSDLEIVAIKLQQNDGTYIDSDSIPQSGYIINKDRSVCKLNNNIVEVTYKNEGGLNYIAPTKKGTKCTLYLDKGRNAAEYLVAKGEMVDELGYRYQGVNPNNYVTFNNELWRIIGVFEVTNSDGYLESLVKIIRNESIGKLAWNTNGTNDWSKSSLMTLLNGGDYYNRENTYSTNGLTASSRDVIESVKWYLGGDGENSITPQIFYSIERSKQVYNGNPIAWIGKVGLMYVSDYGYAVDSASCARTTALKDYSLCITYNWLYKDYEDHLTISPNSDNSISAYILDSGGYIYTNDITPVSFKAHVHPTLYLKSTVSILDNGKDGSESKPYDLVLS